jgi:hypothetical protein
MQTQQNFGDIVMLGRNNMVKCFPLLNIELFGCEGYALGKQRNVEFSKLSEIEKRKMLELELVHINLCEPMQTKYILGFIF